MTVRLKTLISCTLLLIGKGVLAAQCLVVGVADGDTLTARCGKPGSYQQVKVRLAGIDAPERKQSFGSVSRQHLSALCFKQQATLTTRSKDRYGRTVANVKCKGKDAGSEQVRAGLAWVYDAYAKKHKHLYPIQSAAKARGIGLWADSDPVPPWKWRKVAKVKNN